MLGNIREVAQKDTDKDPYYMPGDYIATSISSIPMKNISAAAKEPKFLMRDALGSNPGRYEDGARPHDAGPENIKLSLNDRAHSNMPNR